MVVTEAPSVHRATEYICKLYQRFYTQTIYPKVIRNLYAIPPSLFVPSAPPWHFVTSVLSVTPCAHYISLLIYPPFSEEPLITLLPCLLLSCYHVFYYYVSCLPLPCYHVFYYHVSCLPLLCYHVSYYPVSCLPLPCTTSSITLSPSRNAKPQKRVDKLIIQRSYTPQNN